jgi:hypothetical protein
MTMLNLRQAARRFSLTLRYPIGVETDSRTPPTIEPQYLKKKNYNFFLCDSRTPLRDNRTPINSLIIFMFDNNRTLLNFKFLKFSTIELQFKKNYSHARK